VNTATISPNNSSNNNDITNTTAARTGQRAYVLTGDLYELSEYCWPFDPWLADLRATRSPAAFKRIADRSEQ